MSLIKCPECKKKISDTVIYCPKCGFSIASYPYPIPIKGIKKNTKKRIFIYSIICVVIALIIFISCFVYSYISNLIDKQNYKYPLYVQDELTTANDLLGNDISTVLTNYIEGENYTVATTDDNISYSFNLDNDSNLIIYADSSTSKITKLEFLFRLSNGGKIIDYANEVEFSRIKSKLTDYYDIDPTYTYLSEKKQVKISKDDFENLKKTKKTTFYVTWTSSKGTAIYSFTNLHEEKKEYGTLTFKSS